jgi:hypothetical protein
MRSGDGDHLRLQCFRPGPDEGCGQPGVIAGRAGRNAMHRFKTALSLAFAAFLFSTACKLAYLDVAGLS